MRLAWGAAHPAVPLADMPAVLRGHRPPATLRFPLALPGLGELLAGFLGGTVPDLPARLVEWRGSAVPFEVSWQRRDRERLDELHAALASAKGLGPASTARVGDLADVADVVPDGGAV